MDMMNYHEIFAKLWINYDSINPTVEKNHIILQLRDELIVNIYIAFRTFDIPGIDIETLAIPFKNAEYVEKGIYAFDDRKLREKYYEHSIDMLAPKVFISELRTKEFSRIIGETAQWIYNVIKKNDLPVNDMLFLKKN